MNTTGLLIAIAILAVVVIAGLLIWRYSRSGRPQEPPAPGDAGAIAPGTTITAEPPDQPAATTGEADRASEAEPEVEPEPEPAPEAATATAELERPEAAESRLVRLRARLARSSSSLGSALLSVLSKDSLSADDWDEIEETLLLADVGSEATEQLLEALRTEVRVRGVGSGQAARAILREHLLEALDIGVSRELNLERSVNEAGEILPAVALVVGVNGAGKTTAIGKLGRLLVAEDQSVVLGAADTFRAAAADQLQTWGQRVGVPVVRSEEGADPASVAFEAVKAGITQEADVVVIDTAGRLQNKVGLMDELGKIKRVAAKQAPITEVLLVLDATTGQNGLVQGRVFAEAVDVTGIVLTKLDGSAKGGIVIAVQRDLGVPVKFVGLGEGPDDLAPFSPEEFVDALLS